MPSDIGILHIYAQNWEHDESYIVGNKKGLIRLRDCLNKVINSGIPNNINHKESDVVFTSDGEGYEVTCINTNQDDMTRPVWTELALPYIEDERNKDKKTARDLI